MKRKRISLFGYFGWDNLGNNSTLMAMLENLKKYVPDADVSCVCVEPERVAQDFHLPTVAINYAPKSGSLFDRLSEVKLLKILVKAGYEPLAWIKAFLHLMRTDMLIVTGTGLLDDELGPFRDPPYALFRWSLLAKLCRNKLYFVSVGAGPITHPLSKFFLRSALALADYRSYRDDYSKDYLRQIGGNVDSDPVYPDLVFSISEALFRPCYDMPLQRTVGVGLYNCDWHNQGNETYQMYIGKIADFVGWLMERNYAVRIILGDKHADDRAVRDLRELVAQRGLEKDNARFVVTPIHSLSDLLNQMAATDFVVASRFHNLVLAMMLDRPVISISYHPKDDELIAGFGLSEYNQPIEEFQVSWLVERFVQLEDSLPQIKEHIQSQVNLQRHALDEQYRRLFAPASL